MAACPCSRVQVRPFIDRWPHVSVDGDGLGAAEADGTDSGRRASGLLAVGAAVRFAARAMACS